MPKSQYYDPAKAHEYYLRTRELKGRQKSAPLTAKQKEGLAYVNSKIAENKKKDLTKAANDVQAQLAKLTNDANAKGKEIDKTMKDLFDKLNTDRTSQIQKISDATQQKIDSLPPIPDGISKKRRDAIMKVRAREIAMIKSSGQKSVAEAIKSTNSAEAQKQHALDKQKLASDLQTSIKSARDNYAKLKKSIVDKYANQSKTENQAIRTNVQ